MKKSILSLTLVLMSSSAFAAGTKFFCKTTEDFEKQTVVVTQASNDDMKEGKKYAFLVEVFNGRDKKPVATAKVQAETEDVSFVANSANGKAHFHVYLDEMDQAALELNGQKMELNCY
jgi:hypothetical protein